MRHQVLQLKTDVEELSAQWEGPIRGAQRGQVVQPSADHRIDQCGPSVEVRVKRGLPHPRRLCHLIHGGLLEAPLGEKAHCRTQDGRPQLALASPSSWRWLFWEAVRFHNVTILQISHLLSQPEASDRLGP